MKHVQIFDGLFSVEEVKYVHECYRKFPYKRTEVDREGLPYTGLSCELDFKDPIVKMLIERTKINPSPLLRAYINLFLKDEKPYFHQDNVNKGYKTLLYYMNPQSKDFNNLGETFFYIDNEIRCVEPTPGRVVIFDAEIWHRASSLRDHDRYTIALKW